MSNPDEGGKVHFVDAPGAKLVVFTAGEIRNDLIVLLHGGPGYFCAKRSRSLRAVPQAVRV